MAAINGVMISGALGQSTRPAHDARPLFKEHVINADSRFEGVGALDVNKDGKLDILSGSYWYEAPSWGKHFVRKVKEQDHYYHDFCDLPMDVDGDGWTDVITCAWHNQAVLWVRNPGAEAKEGQAWEEIQVDKPGPMETGMLFDINGDGQPDMLPNIAPVAAWYERKKDAAGPHGVTWERHNLPKQAAGHGSGAGDINGDKRVDIIGPRGWAEQGEKGKWIWHAEFDLGAASVPIQVMDVDGDGDADLVWGMGHDFGLHWLEQGKDADGKQTWTKHLIDKSFSQAHVVLAADLDGDGQDEIFTGKRFYAHETDPGANEPRCLYWYKYDRADKVWTRHVIQEGGKAGTGTMSQIIDIDGDGDLDIVCPGKSGLYLYENLSK